MLQMRSTLINLGLKIYITKTVFSLLIKVGLVKGLCISLYNILFNI